MTALHREGGPKAPAGPCAGRVVSLLCLEDLLDSVSPSPFPSFPTSSQSDNWHRWLLRAQVAGCRRWPDSRVQAPVDANLECQSVLRSTCSCFLVVKGRVPGSGSGVLRGASAPRCLWGDGRGGFSALKQTERTQGWERKGTV